MRQLKAFMKAKRGVCSKRCECLTINARRCADLQNGEEFCGCGESKSSLPNYVRVDGQMIYFFNENEEQGNTIAFVDEEVRIGQFLGIEDEDARDSWVWAWGSLDVETIQKLFGMGEGKTGVGHFTPEAMAQFNTLINNPTEEQVQTLTDWLVDKASNEQLIVVFNE